MSPAHCCRPERIASQPALDQLSSAGGTVRAETAFPVAVGARMAIPTGTCVDGALARVKRHGFEIHLKRLVFANGYAVPLPAATAQITACGPAPGTVPVAAVPRATLTAGAESTLVLCGVWRLTSNRSCQHRVAESGTLQKLRAIP